MQPAHICLLLPILFMLSGCGEPSAQDKLEDYVTRIANTLELEPNTHSPYADLQPFPPRRERLLPLREVRTGLLETLELSDCRLLPLIAERNSSLGRVMKPSTQLSYELRFFDRLAPCYRDYRRQPGKDEQRMHLLQEIYQSKRHNLPSVVWNGFFTSEAMERNFSLAGDPIPLGGNPGFGDGLRALEYFNGILNRLSAYRRGEAFDLPNLQPLEQHYFALHASSYGSQLIKSVALLTHHLNQASELLQRAMERRPLCFNGTPNPKARILKNVLLKYYAGGVQPYMARIHKNGQLWLTQMNRLMDDEQLPVPASSKQYRHAMVDMENEQGLWRRYQRAIERHTQSWQQVLKQCGLMPGG